MPHERYAMDAQFFESVGCGFQARVCCIDQQVQIDTVERLTHFLPNYTASYRLGLNLNTLFYCTRLSRAMSASYISYLR